MRGWNQHKKSSESIGRPPQGSRIPCQALRPAQIAACGNSPSRFLANPVTLPSTSASAVRGQGGEDGPRFAPGSFPALVLNATCRAGLKLCTRSRCGPGRTQLIKQTREYHHQHRAVHSPSFEMKLPSVSCSLENFLAELDPSQAFARFQPICYTTQFTCLLSDPRRRPHVRPFCCRVRAVTQPATTLWLHAPAICARRTAADQCTAYVLHRTICTELAQLSTGTPR